jgi:hypothetical protein
MGQVKIKRAKRCGTKPGNRVARITFRLIE